LHIVARIQGILVVRSFRHMSQETPGTVGFPFHKIPEGDQSRNAGHGPDRFFDRVSGLNEGEGESEKRAEEDPFHRGRVGWNGQVAQPFSGNFGEALRRMPTAAGLAEEVGAVESKALTQAKRSTSKR